ALVAIEDAQWDVYARAESLNTVRIVVRGIVCIPPGEGWIGRAIRNRQFVIGLRLLDGFKRCLQVGTRRQRRLAEAVERIERVGEIEDPGHVELIQRRAIIHKLQQLNLGSTKVYDGRLQFRFVLHAQQLDAVEIDLRNVAGPEPGAADLD